MGEMAELDVDNAYFYDDRANDDDKYSECLYCGDDSRHCGCDHMMGLDE